MGFVVRGPFGEDGHGRPVGQSPVGGGEGVDVVPGLCGAFAVLAAGDGEHPEEPEHRPDRFDLPERGLGDEAGDATQRVGDDHGVHEPVQVVGDDERRPGGGQVASPQHLDFTEVSGEDDPRQPAQRPVASPQQRRFGY